MKRSHVILLAACSLAIAVPASTANAQSVIVHVTSAESGAPLSGAFVSLLDSSDVVVRSGLTNESGDIALTATTRGTYRVKVELIGRAPRIGDPFTTAGEETTRIAVALAQYAIPLMTIEVDADQRCRVRPDQAPELARVWEAARTSLAVQAWTDRQSYYRLDISTYQRDLDADARTVLNESRRASTRVTRAPFEGLAPEDLADGFVRRLRDGGHQYFGPDANLLMSDEFLDTHCFRLTRSDDNRGSIGLAFEPAEGDNADIRGTLWLDEDTGHLRFLEYRYTRLQYREAESIAGGRIEFEALPNGAWIIRRWWIRMPILARFANMAGGGDSGIRVTGVKETGGEVLGVSTLRRERLVRAERGSLMGVVWDSTRGVPLAGARVVLSGTDYTAQTDTAGRFAIEDLADGVYSVEFTHARLDTLGVDAPAVEADIETGTAVSVALAVPSFTSIAAAVCGDPDPRLPGVLLGTVTDMSSGEAIPGATVRAEWQAVVQTVPLLARNRWVEVTADATGRFVACGLPAEHLVRVQASLLHRDGTPVDVTLASAEPGVADLAIDLPARVAPAESGVQGVQGSVTDRESDAPVRSAEVTIRQVSGEVVATGVTDDRGFFRIQAPSPGQYLLTIDALGYAEVTGEPVDIDRGQLTVLEIAIAPQALALDPVVVTAESRSFHLEMQGFYGRADEGLGVFFGPEVLERRRPTQVSDLLFGVPGVNVAEPVVGTPSRARAVYFRGRSGACWPMVYIDRHLVSTGGLKDAGAEPAAVDDLVHVADVAAVEVYRPPAEIPSEFNGPNAGCGVIVLWTRRGGG